MQSSNGCRRRLFISSKPAIQWRSRGGAGGGIERGPRHLMDCIGGDPKKFATSAQRNVAVGSAGRIITSSQYSVASSWMSRTPRNSEFRLATAHQGLHACFLLRTSYIPSLRQIGHFQIKLDAFLSRFSSLRLLKSKQTFSNKNVLVHINCELLLRFRRVRIVFAQGKF